MPGRTIALSESFRGGAGAPVGHVPARSSSQASRLRQTWSSFTKPQARQDTLEVISVYGTHPILRYQGGVEVG
jgi:hypothetical protein